MDRKSGILLPVFSLPSPYGIGTMGKEAFRWIDYLASCGQKLWQVLPLGPTGFGDSPYQSFSSFAGNPYFIDLEILKGKGLLEESDLEAAVLDRGDNKVSYDLLYERRYPLLRKAFEKFEDFSALEKFKEENPDIASYALFMAIKDDHKGMPWYMWEEGLKRRYERSIKKAERLLKDDINFYLFLEMEFLDEWKNLKAYASEKGIEIIGDVPIYASLDSADVWKNPREFNLGRDMLPREVAGVPPDDFTDKGQKWGNPLYKWHTMRRNNFTWWKDRLSFAFTLFDVIRIDHFRGLESYYSIPAEDEDAKRGHWVKGPDKSFISFLKESFPDKKIIAEDLGFLTDDVYKLLKLSGFPGMKVLQFGFTTDEENEYLPHNLGENSVVYTGTHDNDTTMGWIKNSPAEQIAFAKEYFNIEDESDEEFTDIMVRAALKSQCSMALIPMQDYLHTAEGRINTPSTDKGNWSWRLPIDYEEKASKDKIRAWTEEFFR